MKLEKWALLAEVVSGTAIILTLVILIIEVRANSELSRIAAYDAVTRDFDEHRARLLSNPESFELFFRFNERSLPDVATEPEAALKLQLLLLNDFGGHERAYLAYQADIIGEGEWNRLHRSHCAEWAIVREHDYYFRLLSFRLTDGFTSHLETDCE